MVDVRDYVDLQTNLPHIYGHGARETEVEEVLEGPGDRMSDGKFPPGWNEERVRKVLAHYESQSEEEAVAEDEAAFEDRTQTVMEIPHELVPAVRELIARHQK